MTVTMERAGIPESTPLLLVWLLVVILNALTPSLGKADEAVFLEEEFESLDDWQPQPFAKISRHSRYSAVSEEGRSCLLMESDNSASALVLRRQFNVYAYPKMVWRWKVSNVFRRGDSSRKDGDDYPARLYVVFAYDPDKAGLGKRIQYQLAKTVYGQYPPDSSISYIWDNQVTTGDIITNAYASEAKMIPVSAGAAQIGTWQEYSVDILMDYRRAFGQDPPATASLVVMSDADNTGESARAWIDYIRISR
jgi:Protein of unknown function (DUF3047)